ncbi:hypothetical protein D3C77_770210 [compost metagenome]
MRVVVVNKQRADIEFIAGACLDGSEQLFQHPFAAPGDIKAHRAIQKHLLLTECPAVE